MATSMLRVTSRVWRWKYGVSQQDRFHQQSCIKPSRHDTNIFLFKESLMGVHTNLSMALILLCLATTQVASKHVQHFRSHMAEDTNAADFPSSQNAPDAKVVAATATTTKTSKTTTVVPAETEAKEVAPVENADGTSTATTSTQTEKTQVKTDPVTTVEPIVEDKGDTTTTTATATTTKATTEDASAAPVAPVEGDGETTTTTATATKTNVTTEETSAAPVENTTTTETTSKVATVSTGDSLLTKSQNVPLADLQTMTTSELTLNLTDIKFPNPKAQGDVLNISGIPTLGLSSVSKCTTGYILNDRTCELANILMMTDLDANNLIVGDQSLETLKGRQAEFRRTHPDFVPITCGAGSPNLGRQGCIRCNEPSPYFSLRTLKCSSCPSGAVYNADARNCQGQAQQFVSNLDSGKYLTLPGQTLNNYKQEIERTRTSNSAIQVCPIQRPFAVNSECISCPLERPLFFIPARTCVSCQAGSTYDPSIHSCTGQKVKTISTTTKTSRRSSKRASKHSGSQSSSSERSKREE